MEQKIYMISDAAKQVEVESHVLRYWEDELQLPIKRNKLGHRYYTAEDVNRLKRIKDMKEQGFQLKAIRRALEREEEPDMMLHGTQAQELSVQMKELRTQESHQELSKADKSYRLQILLKNMMIEAIREGNENFAEEIKESVLKELDYQFRIQEEREDAREKERLIREEEHYKQIDSMLREKTDKKEKRKKHSFF